jgi:hypothetical protein
MFDRLFATLIHFFLNCLLNACTVIVCRRQEFKLSTDFLKQIACGMERNSFLPNNCLTRLQASLLICYVAELLPKNCLTKKAYFSMPYKGNMLQNACEKYKLLSNRTKKFRGKVAH